MPTGDTVFKSGASLGSGETDNHILKQPGADKLSGSVTRKSTNYNVDIVWQDGDGNDIETESVASGVGGGTQTTFDVTARSPYAKLQIGDDGSGSGTYDLTAHFR